MATNPYFSYKVRNEQRLYEDLIIEALKMYGQDVYYLPREILNKDTVFLDDIPSRFSNKYKIEMYIENTEGFDGEGDIFTKFGIELRDQATFIVARKRWKSLIGNNLDEKDFRPREGDLIFLELSNSIFQITKVETETPFYQLSQLPTFRMTAELFEYNDEDFDTGVSEIDVIEKEGAYSFAITMDSDAGGYLVGETISQSFDSDGTLSSSDTSYAMKGEITRWNDSDRTMWVAHVGATDGKYHEFTTTRQIIGQTSNAVATPTSVTELQQILEDAQNATFDSFEDDFLDFSENNPFGDPE